MKKELKSKTKNKSGGWFKTDNRFVEEAMQHLSPAAISIYIVLRRYRNEGNYAWPSMQKIAEKLGVRLKTVQRNIGQLEKYGLIEREKRIRQRSGQWANYRYYLLEPERWVLPTIGQNEPQPQDIFDP